jgi:hypothetical protein
MAGDQDPSPSTLFGAVGGQIARQLGAHGQRDWNQTARTVLGPFQPSLERKSPEEREGAELLGATVRDAEGTLWFPAPLHLRAARQERGRYDLTLRRPPDGEAGLLSSLPAGWRPLSLPDPAAAAGEEEERPLRVDRSLLQAILVGEPEIVRFGSSARREEELFQSEPRLGLAMFNATNTTAEGRLFARPYRRYRTATDGTDGWRSAGFVAWYRVLALPAGAADVPPGWNGVGFLGGDRRRALFSFARTVDGPLGSLRDEIRGGVAGSRGFLVYLLTPALLPAGGVDLEGRRPVAGALGRAIYTSGWSAAAEARGPRPLLALAPPGSVLFFEWNKDETDADKEKVIERQWLGALDPAYGNAGFGRMLPGVWR